MMMAFFSFLVLWFGATFIVEGILKRKDGGGYLDLKKDAVSYFLMMGKEHSSTIFIPFGLIYDDMHSRDMFLRYIF